MELFKIINKKIKKFGFRLNYNQQKRNAIEVKYYSTFFIENENWNKPNPNEEEILRWNIIEKFIHNIIDKNKNEKLVILDLGCGRGWLSNLLSGYGEVKGVEPIKPVVEYAKQLFSNLDISCGTSKTLLKQGFKEKFDLVVASEVIEHIKDNFKKEFVQDIRALLKPGGYTIITTPRKESETEWKKHINPNQPIENWITESILEDLFVKEGFTKRKFDRFSIPPLIGVPAIEIYQLWLFQK